MIEIIPAQPEHAKLLFEWRNDALTRAMFKNSDVVEWDTHIAWLTARLEREIPHLYVALFKGLPIGTFRLDGDEISYTIAPDARRQGLGVAMVSKACEMFGTLRAEIYERNVASIKIATRAGLIVHILPDHG